MRRVLLTSILAFTCACGSAPVTAGGQTSSIPATSPLALTCTASGAASASWPAPETVTGSEPAIVSAAVSGDTLTLVFASGTPQFKVEAVPSAQFTMDPSGRPVDLAGAAGVRIVLQGFRGDKSNFDGQNSLTSSGPILLQASKIGDYEGIVSFGAGVSTPACASVSTRESSLAFHFIRAPQPAAGS